MLIIKKSRRNGSFILYDNSNFNFHTHVKRKDLALIILRNVLNNRVPKSHDIEFIKSHIRVSKNKKYIETLNNYLNKIERG